MMKHLFIPALVSVMTLCGAHQVAAQKNSGEGAKPAFDKGDKTLGISAGFGVSYGLTTASAIPAIAVNYDQGIVGNVGPGTIGVGGIVGYKASRYKYWNDAKYTYSNIVIGVRGTYHLTILKDKNNKFDPYAGVTMGLRIWRWNDDFYNTSSNSVSPIVGGFVGAKYNFASSVGAFAELGYDVSFARIGLCVNF
jgi:hypothetical protein